MSVIYVKISGIQGEATHPDYKDQIECVAMRHSVSLPVVSAAIRVEGTSTHGPIVLSHAMDKASAVLRQSVLTGANLGEVEITRMRTVGGAATPTETITLSNAFVVRVDSETMIDEATRELSDELVETFHLEYSEVKWSEKRYNGDVAGGTVQGGWSLATQQVA
ncbi:MAG: type VI secretion system tube protein Hcp [Aestuariivita sp.]|nr:type VI secretion system tube protein Hcp [Aestuariivita sp.]